MTYSTWLYTFYGVMIPVVSFFLLLVLAGSLIRILYAKKQSLTIAYLPMLCLVIVCTIAIQFSPGYRYPVCAAFQQRSDRYITTGYVTAITDAPKRPMYYDAANKRWCSGKLLTIGGNRYYIPYGDVKVGDAVELLWGSDEQVVYQYSVKPDLAETEFGTRLVYSADPESQKSTDSEAVGTIGAVFFYAFVAYAALWPQLGKRISIYLEKKDRQIKGRIVPTKFHWLMQVVQHFLILGIVIVLVIGQDFYGALLIYGMYACVCIFLLIKKARTELVISGDSILYKSLNETLTLRKVDVVRVELYTPRDHVRRLVIVFRHGLKLVFAQTEFLGLSSVYNELSKTGDLNN